MSKLKASSKLLFSLAKKLTWYKNHFLANNEHFDKITFFLIEKVQKDMPDLEAPTFQTPYVDKSEISFNFLGE